mgnify:CR=1 FL=1
MNPVFVIGHRNPDTDSICSAICYAHLKRRLTGGEYIACRAGHVNAETKFVLERFGVEPPRYIKSFEPRLSDVQYREVPGISEELSLHRAWDYMNENDIQTLAVVDEDRRLKGLLTLGDIARFYIEDQDANALAEAKTSYRISGLSRAVWSLRRLIRMYSRTISAKMIWLFSATVTKASCAPLR